MTSWVVILVIFHKYTYKHMDLLYLTFLCFIIGSYISFVKPGYFIVLDNDNTEIKFQGFHKFIIVDLALHFIFLMFVYSWYYNYYINPKKFKLILSSILLVFVYLIYVQLYNLFYNKKSYILAVEHVYNISFIEFLCTFAIATSLYFFI